MIINLHQLNDLHFICYDYRLVLIRNDLVNANSCLMNTNLQNLVLQLFSRNAIHKSNFNGIKVAFKPSKTPIKTQAYH